jgi:hypothetical protein
VYCIVRFLAMNSRIVRSDRGFHRHRRCLVLTEPGVRVGQNVLEAVTVAMTSQSGSHLYWRP